MKKLLLTGCGLLLAAALVSPAFATPSVPAGPINMSLTKKPVVFDHAQHASVDCATCHHQVAGQENYQKCSTSGCHDVLGTKDKSEHSYYRIAHNRKVAAPYHSCLSCHVDVAKQNPDKKKALTSCSGSSCHPKK